MPFSRGRVLLVDDEAAAIVGLTALLELEDLDVYSATTIADAKKLLDSMEFDVVVSDYQMPNGTGLDVLRHMRQRTGKSVGLIWTGRADLAAVRPNASAESFRVIPKSDAPDLLVNVIRQSIALARLRSS